MSFGGEDVVFEVSPGVAAAGVILKAMRQFWPGAQCLEADGDDLVPVDSPRVLAGDRLCGEFFVFRDRAAAQAWLRDGATPDNANSMLHFLMRGDDTAAGDSPHQVTLVCDELTEPIRQLISDLTRGLRGLPQPAA